MTEKISRRDFLKLAGLGGAAATVLTGCGPASRYVTREPYHTMPEYNYNGQSTHYATTCRECAAGCGLVVRTMQGRALKVEGNKRHPVNAGKTCARGQAAVQGLYNPDRVQGPHKHTRGAGGFDENMTWDEATAVVADALKNNHPEEVVFMLGLAPDHLADMVSAAGFKPLRFGALGMFESRATLSQAAQKVFGKPGLPHFDIGGADVTFSFGANFLETWLSPVSYTRGFSQMRGGTPGRRGYLVQFEPRMSQTAMTADEWIAVKPGTEGLVALAIGRLAAEAKGTLPQAFLQVNVEEIAQKSGVALKALERLGRIFGRAERALAIPGGAALGQTNGLQAAEAALALNALAGNLGQPGGVFMTPPTSVGETAYRAPASTSEVLDVVKAMNAGKVKALFVHGVNPLFELPAALRFADALKNVPLVVSFASFPDETALQSDYIFPDHTALESFGYQRVWAGADRATLSGAQPVVAPFYNTRATADVLLAAAAQAGGALAAALPFADEVAFIENALLGLVTANGFYAAPEIKTFMTLFQQYGGWWTPEAGLEPVGVAALDRPLAIPDAEYAGEGEFFLHVFPAPLLGDGAGANRPWLQETPDPTTTVMWNSWVEINPKTAEALGLKDDDVVLLSTAAGVVEAVVYKYPAIRPDTIAIPFGQGHTALGRYAENRGANPAQLLGIRLNEAGDLAFGAMKVSIKKKGLQRPLARFESRVGVYGDGYKE